MPTYFLRYEDLCVRGKETLSELFCFLLNVKSIEGTVIEKRISDLVDSGGNSAGSVYKLKSGQDYTKLLRNESKYTPEQTEYLKKELKQAMLFFGYTEDPSGENNTDTSFFKYDSYDEADKERYLKFRRMNKEVFEKVGTPAFVDNSTKYEFNKDEFINCGAFSMIATAYSREM